MYPAHGKISVRFFSLGCPKNLVDSEVMAGILAKNNFKVLPHDNSPCDAVIVNTCGFIEAAKQESIDALLKLAMEKKKGNIKLVVAAGCLSQRYVRKLPELLPEVDAFIGTGDFSRLSHIIHEKLSGLKNRNFVRDPAELADSTSPRLYSTPFYTRYVKISEGCSHKCSFCAIPQMRGKPKSRTPRDIFAEIQQGIDSGVKEFNLIAQDLNEYGRDLEKRESLSGLINLLASCKGEIWLRLLYMYPLQFPDRLVDAIRNNPHVVSYVDIPLQHIDDRILRSMRRGSSSRHIYRLIEKLRKKIPDIVIRTAFIAGYPGETDRQFGYLVDFINKAEFDHVGVFPYSPEEKTPSAGLSRQIPEKTRNERRDILMKTQQKISLKKNRGHVGKTFRVLANSSETGRFYGQAPEIDGVVRFCHSKKAGLSSRPSPGQFVPVRITSATEYDLKGEIG